MGQDPRSPHPARRRATGFVLAAALVPTAARRGGVTWDRLVGPTLAAESALVGLDAAGTIRVAVRNEATRRELLARAATIVASFNAQGQVVGARRAERLVCWVASSFYKPREPAAAERALGCAPADPEEVARARVEVASIAPRALPGVAEALARVRARQIARRGRAD